MSNQQDGKASLFVPPLSTNLFNVKGATKTPKTPAPVTPTPAHSTMMGGHPLGPYTPQPYGYPPPIPYPNYLYPPPPPPYYANPPQAGPSNTTHRSHHHDFSPPRSSPPLPGGSIEEFCEQYGLSDLVSMGLKDLGFEIGDDLSLVKDAQWANVNIPPLTVHRIIRYYRKYKELLRRN
jgi:hypothetical protein